MAVAVAVAEKTETITGMSVMSVMSVAIAAIRSANRVANLFGLWLLFAATPAAGLLLFAAAPAARLGLFLDNLDGLVAVAVAVAEKTETVAFFLNRENLLGLSKSDDGLVAIAAVSVVSVMTVRGVSIGDGFVFVAIAVAAVLAGDGVAVAAGLHDGLVLDDVVARVRVLLDRFKAPGGDSTEENHR